MRPQISTTHFKYDFAVYALREIRQKHERIFALVGEFIDLVKANAEASRLLILLEKIVIQTSEHCRSEENILKQLKHPSLAIQSEDHSHILGELVDFRDCLVAGGEKQGIEYMHLLDRLIIHHVSDEFGFQNENSFRGREMGG